MKFQATTEKIAKNLRGLFFAAPCIWITTHLPTLERWKAELA